ncbi:cob(I)yrinic acid a,c-diamide adenosyltransferase [Tardiphaga sp.]|uniref:cob(I)yrinic acid a,c-diamide adenosyltransferase n=1 Tax=Tardiphaga sp. TaxID=1926292 RepID=UPI0025CEF63E|nr:cob(I)yrinic acid a,c-diamide adenosyltransferase [Tardiphaga sp.]
MVILNKIYTRTGDDGSTALGTGERCPKFALRISAYGTVDETNAQIGVVRVLLAPTIAAQVQGGGDPVLDKRLALIQNDLFDLGADLCVPDRGQKPAYEPLRISQAQVDRLETEIDDMNAALKPLRSFVLPGGSPAAAALHVARTVSRRAERLMVELAALPDEPVSAPALKYINRLSDYLFVASRHVNNKGEGDVLWVPGKSR